MRYDWGKGIKPTVVVGGTKLRNPAPRARALNVSIQNSRMVFFMLPNTMDFSTKYQPLEDRGPSYYIVYTKVAPLNGDASFWNLYKF